MLRTPKILAGKRPSGPMVVSTMALVVALGGTSYAAATIGTDGLRNGAVTSPKIKDGTIKKIDLAPGLKVAGPEGPQGPPGADGADGIDGVDGARGPAGVGRWALVEADGTISAQSGGFTVVAAYPATPDAANGNVYLNANEPLGNNGIIATIALENTSDLNADGISNGTAAGADSNPEFSGEIAVSRCNTGDPTTPPTPPTACAPAGARNATSFVVSPRNSDGTRTTTTTRKRFYVVITGDSSDYVAP